MQVISAQVRAAKTGSAWPG